MFLFIQKVACSIFSSQTQIKSFHHQHWPISRNWRISPFLIHPYHLETSHKCDSHTWRDLFKYNTCLIEYWWSVEDFKHEYFHYSNHVILILNYFEFHRTVCRMKHGRDDVEHNFKIILVNIFNGNLNAYFELNYNEFKRFYKLWDLSLFSYSII